MTVADVLQKISEYHDTFHGRHCRPSRTDGVEARNRLFDILVANINGFFAGKPQNIVV